MACHLLPHGSVMIQQVPDNYCNLFSYVYASQSNTFAHKLPTSNTKQLLNQLEKPSMMDVEAK